uniref:Uncharacterized protein n=1 Tax=Oryza brachyantha TaxID=4533 RepID=J3MH86_ORYBR
MSVVAAAAAVGSSPVGASSAYGMCGGGGGARKRKDVVQQLEEDPGGGDAAGEDAVRGLFVLETVEEEAGEEEEEEEEQRSSIGDESEEDDDEEEEVESKGETWRRKTKKCGGALTCLDALDDALPIKRGLSNFFSGKSRSFANLQDVAAGATAASGANEIAKPENPFNKRRRILRCSSIRRVSSTSLTALPPFLPAPQPLPDDGINGAGGNG